MFFKFLTVKVFPFCEGQYAPDYPSELWGWFVSSLTEQERSYVQSLTDEQYEEYCEEQRYVPDYLFGDKEDVLWCLSDALENPDWVTPDLYVYRESPAPRKRPGRPPVSDTLAP